MAQKFCEKCGEPLPENAKFCSNCGAPVVNKEEPIKQTGQPDSGKDSKAKTPSKAAYVKFIAIIIAVLAVLNLWLVPYMNERKDTQANAILNHAAKENPDVTNAIKLPAGELLAAYKSDRSAADAQFKTKKVNMTGTIIELQKYVNFSHYYHMILAEETANGKTYAVDVLVPETKEEILEHKPGDKVVVHGKVRGMTSPTDSQAIVEVDYIKLL